MPQFTVVFTDGGSYLVAAADKYAAIEKCVFLVGLERVIY